MPRVTRRAAAIAVTFSLLLALSSVASATPVPDGPRLAFGRGSERPFKVDLQSVGPSGFEVRRITGGTVRRRPVPGAYQPPSWSPDGSLMAFSGMTGKIEVRGAKPLQRKIFLVGADGSGRRPVPGTSGGMYPVFSPDGQAIAFAREREWRTAHGGSIDGRSVWLVNLAGGPSRQLTPWVRGEFSVPSSFSHSGTGVAFTRQRFQRAPEVVVVGIDSCKTVVLERTPPGRSSRRTEASWPWW